MIKLKRKVFNALADNALFRRDLKMVAYRLDGVEGIRNIIGMQGFKQVLLIFCDNKKNISEFIEKIKIILYSLCFDEDIVESMRHLNDGFENRKKEIIYHLYCIENEILKIMKQIPQGYREIGDRMSIDCSPERSRDIVRSSLTKEINGIDVNCELHTKMKRLTSNAPDRVYLTRNGRGEYAIMKLNELDKLKATIRLLTKLEEGEKSAREKGWLSADDVEAMLGV